MNLILDLKYKDLGAVMASNNNIFKPCAPYTDIIYDAASQYGCELVIFSRVAPGANLSLRPSASHHDLLHHDARVDMQQGYRWRWRRARSHADHQGEMRRSSWWKLQGSRELIFSPYFENNSNCLTVVQHPHWRQVPR